MHIRVQTRELAVGPIGIIGLNTDSPFNADGRLNGTAIVVRGHAIQRARVDAPYDPLLHPLLRPSIPSRKLCAPFFLVSCSSFLLPFLPHRLSPPTMPGIGSSAPLPLLPRPPQNFRGSWIDVYERIYFIKRFVLNNNYSLRILQFPIFEEREGRK